MGRYERPQICSRTFTDADGNVIDYGRRWGGSPPDDTYSVVTHPERFAPLHDVADALVAYLRKNYQVMVREGKEYAADLQFPPEKGILRAVRLDPAGDRFAPLTFVFTDFPGIWLAAGALTSEPYPSCGCDACDEEWAYAAEDMEDLALAAARGYLQESVDGAVYPSFHNEWKERAGKRGSTMPYDSRLNKRLRQAKRRLRELPNGWEPWPLAD